MKPPTPRERATWRYWRTNVRPESVSGTLVLLLVGVGAAACHKRPEAAPPQALEAAVFTNVMVIDGTGTPPTGPMTVVVQGRRIAEIFPAGTGTIPARARVVDGSGKYLIPGLIDAHVHLGTRADRPREITERVLGAVFMGGVTSVRDMGGRMGTVRPLALRSMPDSVPWPRIRYAAVMAGPGSWFEGERGPYMAEGGAIGASPLVRLVSDTTDIPAAITAAKEAGATGVKLYNSLSLPIIHSLAAEARRQGLRVWGHMAVDPARPSELIAAGVEVLSHADQIVAEILPYPAPGTPLDVRRAARMEPFRTATPDLPPLAQLFRTMREQGTILDPTLFIMTPEPDSTGRVAEDAATLHRFAVAMVRGAHDAGVAIATGTDAIGGSTPNLHVELQFLTDHVGMSPGDVIRSATSVGARALGIADSLGVIRRGMVADLVLLARDPLEDIANTQTVVGVMKGGYWFPRDAEMRAIPRARPPRTQ